MKVSELIAILSDMPPTADVVIMDADEGNLLGDPTVTYDGAEDQCVIESDYQRRL